MVNKNLLFGKVMAKGLTNQTVALELGITPHSFSSKANGKNEFKCNEIGELIKLLGLTPDETMAIFFNE